MKSSSSIFLERAFSFDLRQRVEKALMAFMVLGALLVIGFYNSAHFGSGILLISLSGFMTLRLLDYYFVSKVLDLKPNNSQSFLVRYILEGNRPMISLAKHPRGRRFFERLGLDYSEAKGLLSTDGIADSKEMDKEVRDLSELLENLFDTSSPVRDFFQKAMISRAEMSLSARMTEEEYLDDLQKIIPLYRESRGRGIGESLAFGEVFLLDQYRLSFDDLGVDFASESHKAEIENIGLILNRSKEANAILVGDDKLSLFSILKALSLRFSGEMIIFNAPLFISEHKDKNSFESDFSKLLKEAAHAGNILFVVPDLPNFIKSSEALGGDAVSLLDPYLASSPFGFLATATEGSYSKVFEHNPSLSARFEKVKSLDENGQSIMGFIISRARALEAKNKILFTSGALLSIQNLVMRFSPDMIIDSINDLFDEALAGARSKKSCKVSKADILSRVESNTGVPLHEVDQAEKEKLSNLENLLGQRVVGQKEALEAVSGALRRARLGISSETRPIGSFLFLGPTGVGKTEASKALSDIFFGPDAPMVRFDMSEYNSDEALARLIGSFENEGTLSSALREHGYGVLLLDEFEKTDRRVIDLFLQILDEGFFSDGQGKRVSVRNHIIIATSNAVSDLIFSMVSDGKDISQQKDLIIKSMIDEGIFKPELLNRFDGVVIFHPLSVESLRTIARLMLEKLNERLATKNITLNIDDPLIEFLVKKGQDPKFGARPLNRAIQDEIEELIAKRMIGGQVGSGDAVTLTAEDLV